jgi:hypothetical protein
VDDTALDFGAPTYEPEGKGGQCGDTVAEASQVRIGVKVSVPFGALPRSDGQGRAVKGEVFEARTCLEGSAKIDVEIEASLAGMEACVDRRSDVRERRQGRVPDRNAHVALDVAVVEVEVDVQRNASRKRRFFHEPTEPSEVEVVGPNVRREVVSASRGVGDDGAPEALDPGSIDVGFVASHEHKRCENVEPFAA